MKYLVGCLLILLAFTACGGGGGSEELFCVGAVCDGDVPGNGGGDVPGGGPEQPGGDSPGGGDDPPGPGDDGGPDGDVPDDGSGGDGDGDGDGSGDNVGGGDDGSSDDDDGSGDGDPGDGNPGDDDSGPGGDGSDDDPGDGGGDSGGGGPAEEEACVIDTSGAGGAGLDHALLETCCFGFLGEALELVVDLKGNDPDILVEVIDLFEGFSVVEGKAHRGQVAKAPNGVSELVFRGAETMVRVWGDAEGVISEVDIVLGNKFDLAEIANLVHGCVE